MAPRQGLEPCSSVLETDTSPLNACGICYIYGGGYRIRTYGTVLAPDSLAMSCFRPLSQPSLIGAVDQFRTDFKSLMRALRCRTAPTAKESSQSRSTNPALYRSLTTL